MRQLLTLIVVCLSASCFSQERKQTPIFTIRGNIGINRPISSSMFHTCFSGIYEANLSGNLRLFGNFYAGAGYQSTYFQNSKFLKNQVFISPTVNTSVPYTTNLIGDAGFLKLGYDKFFMPGSLLKGYVSYSINSGMMFMHYNSVNADTSNANKPFGALRFTAPYVQPEVSVNFIAEKMLSFSFMVSYTTLFYNFDPKAPRFNQFDAIYKKRNHYVMSWMNIAVGFNVLFGK